MATSTKYDMSTAIREDLEDIIYNISPTATPFMSAIGRISADNTYHEWQQDTLATASATPVAEGVDAVDSFSAPIRNGNYTQINQKALNVSGTSMAVDAAGMSTIRAYLTAKHGKELKRDMETALLANTGGNAGSGTTTARVLAGLPAWIRTTAQTPAGNGVVVGTVTGPVMSGGASSGAGVPTAGWTLTSGAAALTEDNVRTAIQSIYTNGGEPKLLLVNPANKSRISKVFTGISIASGGFAWQVKQDLKSSKQATIVGASDVYLSDFGPLAIQTDLFVNGQFAYLVDPEYAKVAYLRPFTRKDLASSGDYERSQLVVEYTLVVSSPLAHGVVANITANGQ